MQKIVLLIFISGFLIINNASAQDTLPDFTVKNFGQKRIVVSWKNTYPLVKQIGIQRSLDSLKNYKTILTVADPMLPENGFFDSRPQTDSMYYRLFIVLDKGDFLFTDPQRPVLDTTKQVVMEQQTATDQKSLIAENKPTNTDQIYNNVTIKSNDSSIVINSFDSTLLSKQVKKPNIYVPSVFVFTQKDGYIQISLPDADTKNYSIKFFEEDDRFLFELKDIIKSNLKLDRTVFYHSGWFKFELLENNKVIEKNKFFLAKDF